MTRTTAAYPNRLARQQRAAMAMQPADVASATLDAEALEKMVREAAYFRAERRGFAPGRDLEDWIAAEQEVDRLLVAGKVVPLGFVGHARTDS
jgi:hypothetical protein